MVKILNRRKFIKTSAVAGTAALMTPKTLFSSTESKRIKLGFIGTGLRGQWMVHLTTKYPEVSIPAICDIDKNMIASTLKILKKSGRNEPRVYSNGDFNYIKIFFY